MMRKASFGNTTASLCLLRSTVLRECSTEHRHAWCQTFALLRRCSQAQAHAAVSCGREHWNFASPCLLPWPHALWPFLAPRPKKMSCWAKIQLMIIPQISHFSVSFTHTQDWVQVGISAVAKKNFESVLQQMKSSLKSCSRRKSTVVSGTFYISYFTQKQRALMQCLHINKAQRISTATHVQDGKMNIIYFLT